MSSRPLLGVTLLLTCATITSTAAPASNNTNPPATESISEQLLEDLAPGMFDEPAQSPADERKDGQPNTPGPELNFRLPGPLDHWNEHGEDVGGTSPAAPLPLIRARNGMHEAKSLLAKSHTVPRAGKVQREVIAQLDQLIAELSKLCQGGNCQPGDQPPKPSQQFQAKPGKSGSKPGRGTTAARDSNSQLNNTASQPVEKTAVDELVRDLWGHLPERSREQMLQSFSGEFLPEYELEIEQYYRRLAEEEAENSAE